MELALKNDYSQRFVDTGERPQNFIRESEQLEDRYLEYPNLRDLMIRKAELTATRATPPFYLQCDLKQISLEATLQSRFDVIMIDPPWEEYFNRRVEMGTEFSSTSVSTKKPFWTYEELEELKIGMLFLCEIRLSLIISIYFCVAVFSVLMGGKWGRIGVGTASSGEMGISAK